MPAFFILTRNTVYAVLFILCLSHCKKKSVSLNTTPDTIVETNPPTVLGITQRVNAAFGGYYQALPEHYPLTTKKYPTIIFLHGAGQTGNGDSDLPYIINDGIGKLIANNNMPATFYVNGTYHSFIIVSPQYGKQPTVEEVVEFIQYVKDNYRVDEKRLYLAGLSLGARVTTLVAATHPELFAAILPLAGVPPNSGMEERCQRIAENNLPVWAFHNVDDPLGDLSLARKFIDLIQNFSPAIPPRLTIFDVYGHDAWTRALDPKYKENGVNIYEWMLGYTR